MAMMAASALVSSTRLLVFPPTTLLSQNSCFSHDFVNGRDFGSHHVCSCCYAAGGSAVISKRYTLCPSCGFPGLSFLAVRRLGRFASLAVSASMLERKVEKGETVIPDPDYRIPIVLLGIAGGFLYQDNLLPAATVGLLGLLLLFQTTRVRFVFDEEALEVRVGEKLEDSGENVFVGGKNRWKYSTFVNWELWWPKFPVLVYFKETQTKPEGQIHFFPVIFNGKQLYDVMVERAGPSNTSMPKY